MNNPFKSSNPKKKSFETLYKEFDEYVYYILYLQLKHCKISNIEEETNTISNEVFFKVFKALPSFNPKNNFSYHKWIKIITKNTCINYLKNKKNIDANTVPFGDFIHTIPVGTSAQSEFEDKIEDIESEEIKEIAKSIYYDGKTNKEIAKDLNISETALHQKLYIHRQKLKGKSYE